MREYYSPLCYTVPHLKTHKWDVPKTISFGIPYLANAHFISLMTVAYVLICSSFSTVPCVWTVNKQLVQLAFNLSCISSCLKQWKFRYIMGDQ